MKVMDTGQEISLLYSIEHRIKILTSPFEIF